MRRAAPFLGLAIVVAGALLIAWRATIAQSPDRDPLAEKRGRAERTYYYRLFAGQPVRFPLARSDTRVKLITHAVMAPAPYDPARRLEYGVVVRVRDGERTTWEHTLFTESRQSKARRAGGVWLDENAFVDDGSVELTDDRLLIVHLPPVVSEEAVLEIENAGQTTELLARAYSYRPRSADARRRAEAVREDADKQAMIAGDTYLPWSFLDPGERAAHLAQRYQRISALGERDLDYQLRRVYYSGFRLPPRDAETDVGEVVSEGRSLAYNVVGPARVTVAGSHPGDAEIDVRIYGPTTPTTAELIPVEGVPATGARTLELGPGLQTVTLASRSATPIAVTVSGAPPSPFTVFEADDVARPMRPERRRVAMWVAGPDGPPLTVHLGGARGEARIVRVDVRTLGAPGAELAPDAVTLELDIDRGTATPLAQERAIVTSPARFERAVVGENELAVSEPVSVRLAPSANARALHVRTSAPALVSFYRYLPTETANEAPYRDVETGELAWRYAPLETRSWYGFRPAEHRALERAGRRAILAGQVRLEPRDHGARKAADQPAVALAPRGSPERQLVLEPVQRWRYPDMIERWPPGSVTRLEPGVEISLALDRRSPGRGQVQYRAPQSAVGATATVTVDGVSTTETMIASRGRWRLPALAPGTHRVEIRAPAGVDLWVDKPPGPGQSASLARLRTVYALDTGELRVAVRRPADRAVALNAVIYHPSALERPDVIVHASVGGGAPARVAGATIPSITASERVRALPATNRNQVARFPDLGGAIAGYPRTIAVPIGEDLVAGTHIVTLSKQRGRKLWVRFFVTARESAADERVLQWKLTD